MGKRIFLYTRLLIFCLMVFLPLISLSADHSYSQKTDPKMHKFHPPNENSEIQINDTESKKLLNLESLPRPIAEITLFGSEANPKPLSIEQIMVIVGRNAVAITETIKYKSKHPEGVPIPECPTVARVRIIYESEATETFEIVHVHNAKEVVLRYPEGKGQYNLSDSRRFLEILMDAGVDTKKLYADKVK